MYNWRRRRAKSARVTKDELRKIEIDENMVIEDVRILFDEQLGFGGYGIVYEGDWRGTPVAVKRVHSALIDDHVGTEQRNAFLENFSREWRLFGHLRHPFIVQFLGVSDVQSRSPGLVMELMDTTLRNRCQSAPYFSEEMTVRLCGEVLCALVYLHARGIVHRDLTTNNVLLTHGEDPTAKISDLGVARALFGDDPRRRVLLSQSTGITRCPGAILYMSPESLDDFGRPYGTKHDVFSFGVLALSTSTRHEPTCFNQPHRIQLGNQSNSTRAVPETERRVADLRDLPPRHPLRDIILECLRDSPADRPAARDILESLGRLPVTTGASGGSAVRDQEDLKVELDEVRQALKASEQKSHDLADRERKALEDVQRIQQQLTTAQQTEQENAQLKQQLLTAEQQLTTTQEELAMAKQQLTATEQRLMITEQRLSTTEQQLATTEQQVDTTKRQLNTKGRQLTDANEQLLLAEQRAESAENECTETRQHLDELLGQREQQVTAATTTGTSQRLTSRASSTRVRVHSLRSYRWKSLPSIPGDGKRYHHTVHIGEWVVMTGGWDKRRELCNRVYAYNRTNQSWHEWLQTPYSGCSSASDGRHLYVLGAWSRTEPKSVRSFYRLSDDKTRWLSLRDMPHAVSYLTGVAVHKRKLFVCCGDETHPGRLQVYDFDQQRWSVLSGQCFTAMKHRKSVLVPWGKYLVANDLTYYDMEADQWHSLPCRNSHKKAHSIAVVKGQLVALGMQNGSSDDAVAVDVLESVHCDWSLLLPLPSQRIGMSACTAGNALFVTGGFCTDNSFMCFSQ